MKRWLNLTLKFALSALLIGFLFNTVDLGKALSQLVEVDLWYLLLATLVMLTQVPLSAYRWKSVMEAQDAALSFLKTFQIVFIGTFFNQTLPSSVGGDAVRIYRVFKAGLTLPKAVNGVMLDRLATVLGLLLVVVVFQPFFIERTDGAVSGWLFPILTVAGITGTGFLMFLDCLPQNFRRWRIVRGLAHLATDTRLVFLHPRYMPQVIFWSVIGHINMSLSTWLLGLSLGLGDQLSLLDCMVLIPPVLLIATLPISIAGWGVREGVMVAALGYIGVSAENALVLSILFGLVVVATALPGGLIWLASSDHHVPQEGELEVAEDLTEQPR